MLDWKPGKAMSEIKILGDTPKPKQVTCFHNQTILEKCIPKKITSWEDWEIDIQELLL